MPPMGWSAPSRCTSARAHRFSLASEAHRVRARPLSPSADDRDRVLRDGDHDQQRAAAAWSERHRKRARRGGGSEQRREDHAGRDGAAARHRRVSHADALDVDDAVDRPLDRRAADGHGVRRRRARRPPARARPRAGEGLGARRRDVAARPRPVPARRRRRQHGTRRRRHVRHAVVKPPLAAGIAALLVGAACGAFAGVSAIRPVAALRRAEG